MPIPFSAGRGSNRIDSGPGTAILYLYKYKNRRSATAGKWVSWRISHPPFHISMGVSGGNGDFISEASRLSSIERAGP